MRSLLELSIICLGLAAGAYLAARWGESPHPSPQRQVLAEHGGKTPARLPVNSPPAGPASVSAAAETQVSEGRFGKDWSPTDTSESESEPEKVTESPPESVANPPASPVSAPAVEPETPSTKSVVAVPSSKPQEIQSPIQQPKAESVEGKAQGTGKTSKVAADKPKESAKLTGPEAEKIAVAEPPVKDKEKVNAQAKQQSAPAVSSKPGEKPKAPPSTNTSRTEKPATAAKPPVPEKKAPVSTDPVFKLVRAQFSTSMAGNEPVDRIDRLSDPSDKAVFFTEFDSVRTGTFIHRWSYKGAVKAEVRLRVQKGRFRTWSIHSFPTSDVGRWTVAVVDPNGHVLATRNLTYAP